eukprot:CAMPEP_0183303376 /NCGR_PEP_ID=MMETSP0160_2-20130417/8838_1 /TAXON_ID=2839 ORGANISM="Odontella Sinensis, Strain Grunow 1884" /NCGR_SAMPLE_ID=MMETSP0160_2 /ASSEMBLY_ACC=CAM_ASM_000250 /LENGTH=220 /DNA_ID=CAMNT_0025466271 /DNA_START=58 /DNA_END=720 /DNA_ORIENTATION=-
MATMEKPKTRDYDELEGSLLPPPPPTNLLPPTDLLPLATVVSVEGRSSSAATPSAPSLPAAVAAVPIQHFEYDEATMEANEKNNGNELEAPFLPDDPSCTNKTESARLRLGNDIGVALAESEREDIDRARRRINAVQYGERERIREANEEAQKRDRQGLKVIEDKYTRAGDAGMERKTEEDPDIASYGQKGGGYEVSEYETSEYVCKEYDTSYEYKSVYD